MPLRRTSPSVTDPAQKASPLRLALCITELERGGVEQCFVELATRLDRRRFHPVVYSLGPRPPDDVRSLAGILESSGIEVNYLDASRTWHAPRALRQLKRALKSQQPDVVITWLFHANLIGRLAAWRADVGPVVSAIRVAERRSRWHLRLDRWTTQLVRQYVCVSRSVAEFSAREGGLSADRLTVIPNAVDIQRYAMAKPVDLTTLGFASGRRAVVAVGRLDVQKRPDWLLRGASDWLARAPSHDLLVVGDGPMRDSAERLAADLGIGDRVHFVGWRADVPNLLAASDLLLLSSAWEGMPNVVLEAMAAGRAVVATDVEGVAELLGPNSTEQIVPLDELKAFSDRVVEMLADPDRRQALGEINRHRADDEFSWAKVLDEYERLLEGLGMNRR